MNVLVTGASRGLGRSLALAFGRDGHNVAVHCHTRRSDAEEVVHLLEKGGVRARVFQSDLAIPDQCRQLVEDVHTAWGRLDVLVNNAGLTRDRPLLKMTPTDWRDVMDVDLSGPFFCLQAAGRLMAAQKDGAILNVSSIIGLRGGLGCANYAAAKAGLLGLTKAAARELGRFNVRVNAVLPGFHETDMSASLPPSAKEKIRARHVLGNSTDRDELARFVVHLSELKTVSGQCFNVDSRIV